MAESIIIKSGRDIELMRQAGRITAGARSIARQAVADGVTTKQIDRQKLPLFNYERYWLPYKEWYWTRVLYGQFSWQDTIYAGAWFVNTDGSIGGNYAVSFSSGVRPLIYIR